MAKAPLQTQLFRRQALAGLGYRAFGEIVVTLPPRAPLVVLAAALACLLLGLGTVLVQIPDRVPAVGILQPAGRIIPVLASRDGIVAGLAVDEGDPVAVGTHLLDIRAAGADDPSSVLAALRRSLERELALLADDAAAAEAAHGAADRALGQRVAHVRRQSDAVAAEVRLFDERVALARRRHERAARLLEAGSVAAHQVDSLAAELVAARVARHAALARRHDLDEHANLLAEQRRQAVVAWRQRERERERERQRLDRESLALAAEVASPVPAPAPGVAGAVLVAEGAPVRAGQLLLQLYAPDTDLEAHLYVAADHAGRVRPGQALELRLRAWPYPLYGTLRATVTGVSAVPVPAASLPFGPPGSGAVFEIRARPDREQLAARWSGLGPGATFDADLLARHWPLYRWLFRGGRPAA